MRRIPDFAPSSNFHKMKFRTRLWNEKRRKFFGVQKITNVIPSKKHSYFFFITLTRLTEKAERAAIESESLAREVTEANKLHDSLIILKEQQHAKERDEIEQRCEAETTLLKEKVRKQEIEMAAAKQEAKVGKETESSRIITRSSDELLPEKSAR